jgi:uncharacterized protein involved in exopolysaccharide biosynthesis
MKEKGISASEIIYILRTKKLVILIPFGVTFLVCLLYTYFTSPVYQATSKILVPPEKPYPLEIKTLYIHPNPYRVQNACEILQSKKISRRAVEILKNKGYKFNFLEKNLAEDTIFNSLTISPIIESEIIEIKAKGSTPVEASAIANAVVEAFILEEIEGKRKSVEGVKKFIEKQLPMVKKNLDEIEEKIKKFKEKEELVSIEGNRNKLLHILTQIELLYKKTEASCLSLKEKLTSLTTELKKVDSLLVKEIDYLSHSSIVKLKEELSLLETNYLVEIMKGKKEDTPKLVELRKSIEKAKKKFLQELKDKISDKLSSYSPEVVLNILLENILNTKIELSGEEAKKELLFKLCKKGEKELKQLPLLELKLTQLEREKEVTQEAYELLMKKYKETQIIEASTISNIRIIEKASPHTTIIIKPKPKLNIAIGTMVGLLLGVISLGLVEYFRSVITLPREVERVFGYKMLGIIPKFNNKLSEEITLEFRKSWEKIKKEIKGKRNYNLLITSILKGEGKTTIINRLEQIANKEVEIECKIIEAPNIQNEEFFSVKGDGIVVVMEVNRITKEKAKKVKEILEEREEKVIGVIVNKVPYWNT